ncbi:MAG TPA: LON peptidase substrate-binding domain-containing protein [Ktedonobacteraceae bacterium]|nr:LON peptidase substrate-binding domain-containing protein [Ktedonobacteraceae bacterium]
MSATQLELPLFPLNVVLFPGMVLPLHIFEPRYLQMIQECQEEKKPFGVVLAQPNSTHLDEKPYPVGTVAEIYELDQLEDGHYNLIAIGGERFRILDQHNEKPYLSGIVETFEDEPEVNADVLPFAKEAYDLFSAYLEMLLEVSHKKDVKANLPTKAEEISHFIAYLLDTNDELKQHFLELRSTKQRLQEELVILRKEVPFLRQILSHSQEIQTDKPDRSILN